MTQEAQKVVPISAATPEEVPEIQQAKPMVHMNRSYSPGTKYAVYSHDSIHIFPDIWQWDFNQIHMHPAIGSVESIVNACSDEPTLGSEVIPLFSQIQAKEWCGKTVLFPRTILVSKGWGKSILGYTIDTEGVCTQMVYSFNDYFKEKVYVAILKQ